MSIIEETDHPSSSKEELNEQTCEQVISRIASAIAANEKRKRWTVQFHRTVNDTCHVKLIEYARENGFNTNHTTTSDFIIVFIYKL